MPQERSKWRSSFQRIFSSKETVTQPQSDTSSPSTRPPTSRGPPSSASDESKDSAIGLKSYVRQSKHANDRVSMVPHKVQHHGLTNAYQMSNTKGPVYFGHREVSSDYQIMLAQTEVAAKITSSAAMNTRPTGLPRTARVMDQIMATHHERQTRLYGNNVEYLQTSTARPGLMF